MHQVRAHSNIINNEKADELVKGGNMKEHRVLISSSINMLTLHPIRLIEIDGPLKIGPLERPNSSFTILSIQI